jgi:hypothetical protein
VWKTTRKMTTHNTFLVTHNTFLVTDNTFFVTQHTFYVTQDQRNAKLTATFKCSSGVLHFFVFAAVRDAAHPNILAPAQSDPASIQTRSVICRHQDAGLRGLVRRCSLSSPRHLSRPAKHR